MNFDTAFFVVSKMAFVVPQVVVVERRQYYPSPCSVKASCRICSMLSNWKSLKNWLQMWVAMELACMFFMGPTNCLHMSVIWA